MKTIAVCLVALGLTIIDSRGQADVLVRERAKNVVNQNNARQGAQPVAPAPASPGAVPRTAPVAARPTVQQQNIAKLKADLARVHQEGKATDPMKQEFARDLLATVQGSGKPSKATLASLSDNLLTALAPKSVTAAADEKLVSKLVVLMNSGGLPARRTQELAAEAQVALESAGVSSEAATRVTVDLRTVAMEIEQTRQL